MHSDHDIIRTSGDRTFMSQARLCDGAIFTNETVGMNANFRTRRRRRKIQIFSEIINSKEKVALS